MAVHGICVVMMDTAQFWQALQCAISFIEPFPATVNHEACVKKLQAAAAAAGLKASFLQEPMRWSEDFGHYLQKTKGAFFGIGCGKEHTGLHTAGYEFDDEIIESANSYVFAAGPAGNSYSIKSVFPFSIIYFVLASVITTVALNMGIAIEAFNPLKTLSKFFIVLSMCAIGLNTNIVKLIKTGGKPILMGFCCWVGITVVSLIMQHMLGLW